VLEQNFNRELSRNSLFSRLVYHRDFYWVKELTVRVVSHFDWRFVFFGGDANLRHGTGRFGLFLWPLIIPLVIGVLHGFKRHFKVVVWLCWWWLAALIPASIPDVYPHALRSLNALPVPAIFIGLGFMAMVNPGRRWMKIIAGLIVGLTAMVFLTYLHDYFMHYPNRSAADWQWGYQQAAEYLGREEFSTRTIYVDNLDRMYLYFLFFNRISPQRLLPGSNTYQYYIFDRYQFINPSQSLIDTMQSGDLLLMKTDNALAEAFGTPIYVILAYNGEPLLAIYEKG
jgi:hypothetical protein